MRKVIRKLRSVVGFPSSGVAAEQFMPRVVTLDVFEPTGCSFNVANSVESYRIEQYGGEEEFTKLILDELRPTDVFFDIGSSVGFVAVHAAKKARKVFAFEPDPEVRARLEANVRLNGLENVEVVDWAVSDSVGTAVLYTDGFNGNSPSLRQVGERGAVQVQTSAIDIALSNALLPQPDVIKLDVEGAELLALAGMTKLLGSTEGPRTVFMEVHPDFLVSFGATASDVLGLMKTAGYEPIYEKVRSGQVHYIFTKRRGEGN